MRDRLARLRHHRVVGGDDEHRDVGDLRAAGAHGGECFVARRVEERDLPAVDVDLVRADVLRDAARLGVDDLRVADRVEQRRLAVIDVAHDRDDRRARLQRVLGVVERLGLLVVVGGVLDRHFALQLGRDQLDLLVGERLRRRLRRAEVEEDLDDRLHRDAERLREVADADARLDRDGTGRRRRRLRGCCRGAACRRGRAPWRGSRGRAAWLSMTTRRRRLPGPLPPRGRSGRFGFPFAIRTPQCKDVRATDRPGRSAGAPARTLVVRPRARSTRAGCRCRRRVPVPHAPERARRSGRRTGRARSGRRAGRSRRTA